LAAGLAVQQGFQKAAAVSNVSQSGLSNCSYILSNTVDVPTFLRSIVEYSVTCRGSVANN
jgi:hypothetical protein